MKIESTKNNIIFLKAKDQYELTSTFLRLQEFYESPNPKFRNKFFELEDYMDWYAKEYGNFTYTSDWSGFNVPGNVVTNFFVDYKGKTLKKENALFKLIRAATFDTDNKFYIIGTYEDGSVVNHEMAHAHFYLDPAYKKQMTQLVNDLPQSFRIQFQNMLLKKGYCKQVLVDETQAYLATNSMLDTVKYMKDVKVAIAWDHIVKFQQAFKDKHDV